MPTSKFYIHRFTRILESFNSASRQLRPPLTSSPSITTLYRRVLFWFVHFIVSFSLLNNIPFLFYCKDYDYVATAYLLPPTFSPSMITLYLRVIFWCIQLIVSSLLLIFLSCSNWKITMTRELHLHTSSHSLASPISSKYYYYRFFFFLFSTFFCGTVTTTMTPRVHATSTILIPSS